MITVTFSCGGCEARTAGTRPVRSEFISLSGQDHGLGCMHTEPVSAVAPEGWMIADPYTGCCYCPACWAAIEDVASPAVALAVLAPGVTR